MQSKLTWFPGSRIVAWLAPALWLVACEASPSTPPAEDAGVQSGTDGAVAPRPDGSTPTPPDGGTPMSTTRAIGQTCLAGDVCEGGFCGGNPFQCPGTCEALGDVGADCARDEECAAGLVCAGTCRRPVGAGEECDHHERPCASDALCASETRDGPDVCQPLGRMGDACSTTCPGSRCTGGCVEGLTCIDATCVTPKANGASCAYHEDCASRTCVGGACASALAMGDPCNASAPLRCPSGSVCRLDASFEDRCQAPGAQGDNCNFSGDCAVGLSCDFDTGTCQPGPDAGEACVFGECANGLACGGDDRCAAAGGPGQPCRPDGSCDAGLACGTPTVGGEGGGCTAPLAVGAPCFLHDQCASRACGASGSCVEACAR